MENIKNLSYLSEITKRYLKENKLKAKDFAEFMDVKPSYLSRVLNRNENMSASTMIKLLNTMGYELVIMTKKEKNLFEQEAYAELYKDSKKYREDIRSEIIAELEHDLKKSFTNFFNQFSKSSKPLSGKETNKK